MDEEWREELLLEVDGDDDDHQIPVLNKDGVMTMKKIEHKEKENGQSKVEKKYGSSLLGLFLEYLDRVDAFYQQVAQFLKSTEPDQEHYIHSYLNQWRRTKGYRWYRTVPLRGDIARYRWTYIPDEGLGPWSRQQAFEEAWTWYFLGIWLMPARGNLYFNLSLLLQTKTISTGYDFHKLYLSTRSLMVRRNGFLNAREGMLALFEGNRRWMNKLIESKQTKKDKKKQLRQTMDQDYHTLVPGLFIKLHGMLFTKIGLDEFAKTRRLFFDNLFPRTITHSIDISNQDIIKPLPSDENFLSAAELFWLETAILCLSSLYSYDYSNSKLTKAISDYHHSIFNKTSASEDGRLIQELQDNVLFAYAIDTSCQIAVECFRRCLDPELPRTQTPVLPQLPNIPLRLNDEFLFGGKTVTPNSAAHEQERQGAETESWLIYIEILLQWIVLNGVCLRSNNMPSFWEQLISDIEYDLVSRESRLHNDRHQSLISPAFWPLLIQFLNHLISQLPHELLHEVLNKHFVDEEDDDQHQEKANENVSREERQLILDIQKFLGDTPSLPEEHHLRGLGWIDEAFGRVLKLKEDKPKAEHQPEGLDTTMRRKIKIIDYGFILVKHLKDILYYDPVDQAIVVPSSIKERIVNRVYKEQEKDKTIESLYDDEEEQEVPTIVAEMDDDVLLSTDKTDLSDEEEEDDIMTQLKKRREQLQSMVTADIESNYYRRLPARAKERENRLNYLRERILPDKTVLVLDTNCFIGHLEHIRKLIASEKWSIIVPLVVITELDGLATNTQRLGTMAGEAIKLIESTLATKSKKSNLLRVQTSHNSFMNNISIRSEQFVFGESDKNLDDLVLSCCLWWISQKNQRGDVVPVCLVTGDRNLSVKARARDVEVVPVSAIMRLTPK
ncbi:hypothetical protein RMCBS344292_15478 [Rhizopus microsporus]|nr:hypothetical protein RMCBS344292_15478 [Rhizopus microsporus]